MHRFSITGPLSSGQTISLAPREAHHAQRVLRVQLGETIVLLDGHGRHYSAEVTTLTKQHLAAQVLEVRQASSPGPRLELMLGLPKPKTTDFIIQKAVELGVSRVVPIHADHSEAVPRDAAGRAKRLEKWRQIAIEALKQCGGYWLPEILPIHTLQEALAIQVQGATWRVYGSLGSDAIPIDDALGNRPAPAAAGPPSAQAWIGPEGDFSRAEQDQMIGAKLVPVTLGNQTLRTETAALYLLSVLHHRLGSPEPTATR